MDLFAAIAAERRGLADVLEGLTDEQWTTPSCCAGWTVEDVAAHLTVVWNYSAFDYVRRSLADPRTWLRPRRALDAVNALTVAERRATGRPALVTALREHAEDRSTPTGFGAAAPLTDLVVHIQDICVPLGITAPSAPAHGGVALDTAVSRRYALFTQRARLRGLSFAATDVDWTHGGGPSVTGPALPLAHVLWGRPASLGQLTGDGVEVLRTRLR